MSAIDGCITIITTIATVLTRSLPLSPSPIIGLEHSDPSLPTCATTTFNSPTMQPPFFAGSSHLSQVYPPELLAVGLPSPDANSVGRVPTRNGATIASRGNSTVGRTSKGVWIATGKAISFTQGGHQLHSKASPSVHQIMVVHGRVWPGATVARPSDAECQ
ncbi:uncharacterized protein BO66DRAFT_440225 [Aspergillus aculeatinus CBS 121060]|uniref:Uncharacterized protein n=1 Tax=Aspergillus aculeatinus CBS 121060 TaxID=1448322 RepID=A0ACD1H3U6_9EURO|nr:hypothetical protein BO66DRAFT_440225 [Aspergillus aculeatinus CBS 121060]RAH68295.1 hypothetical protein BO66DRAFT_440225 [Aspergillus aculeatinus CBS 121060]